MTHTTALTYADVVDLDHYPINDLDSDRGRAFIADCREQLRRDGVCNLPGFVTAQAGTEMIRHAAELDDGEHHAHFGRRQPEDILDDIRRDRGIERGLADEQDRHGFKGAARFTASPC